GEEEMRQVAHESLQVRFLPEFLNRIDETIIFHPLSRDQLRDIAKLQVGALQRQLVETGLGLEITDAAMSALAEQGFASSSTASSLPTTSPSSASIRASDLATLRSLCAGLPRAD
ncbi:MAG: hypothetical protein IIA65_05730, partial [Planctomycetes bacterium]|nr:hypothetical protein [Planctomycetota bacterium]